MVLINLIVLGFLQATAAALTAPAVAPVRADTIGCYWASPPLTYSTTGAPERGDSAWAIVRLVAGGAARRVLLRPSRDGQSNWEMVNDTLVLTVSDGLVGWRARLTATEAGWRGIAEYLTDVRTVPPFLYRHELVLTRRSCPPG